MKVLEIQNTPNPEALKFVLDQSIVSSGVRQFDSIAAATEDPLARRLFLLPGVESVFFTGNFVTVRKARLVNWNPLRSEIVSAIENESLTSSAGEENLVSSANIDDKDMYSKIATIIDANVRPALEGDGGGLEIQGLKNGVLTIRYQGACGGCPSAAAGTLVAVENLLQRMVDPKIKVVAA